MGDMALGGVAALTGVALANANWVAAALFVLLFVLLLVGMQDWSEE